MVSVLRLLAISATALALWASPAAADCTGQFGAGQICNNPTGATAPPVPTANPVIGTASSVITFSGRVLTSASTTTRAGLNLPHGTAPSAPVNGDLWSTTSGFYGRVNGTTVGPFTDSTSGSFAGTSPITVSFPAGVVTYAFNFTVANSFLATQTFRTLLAGTTNTYDIGTSATVSAFRTIYAGTSFVGPIGTFTTSVAIGGATIGSDALGVTGTATISGNVTGAAFVPTANVAPSDGMYLNAAGQTAFSAGGVRIFFFNSTGLLMANASGATLSSAAATATAPTVIPRRSDSGTGIGSSGTASLSLIATSIEQLRINNGSIYVGGATTGSNTAAVAPTISGALSTGTATNPDLVFQTGVATTSGSSQATATTALTIKGETQAVLAVGNLTIKSSTAIPAGGTQDVGYLFSSTAHFGTLFGSGAPSLSAAQGSLYLRSDGSAGARTYVNTNGTTGWVALADAGSAAVLSVSNVDGTLTISPNSGAVVASIALSHSNAWLAAQTIQSASATAFAVGLNGATNPAFQVDASTALQVAGLKVTGAVTGGTVALAAVDSGSNANLTINAKGSGTIGIGSVSTGAVTITPNVTNSGTTTLSGALTYGGVTLSNSVSGTGSMVLSTSAALTTPNIGAATGTSLSTTGAHTAFNATAIPAGGTTGSGYLFSSTANYGVFFGSGAPTSSAAQGSLYLRSDGSPYYNNNGSTGWTALAAGGSVSSVTCGTGLTGGTFTTTGTCAVDIATQANIWAATASKILDAATVFNSAGALQTPGGTASAPTFDFNAGINWTFTATTATNYTLQNPTNAKPGQSGCIDLFQPGSGSVVTIALGTNWQTAGGTSTTTLTATLGAKDQLCYWVQTSSIIQYSFANNVSH